MMGITHDRLESVVEFVRVQKPEPISELQALPIPNLRAQYFADQVTSLLRLRNGEGAEDVTTVSPCADDFDGFKDGQVLGEIRLGNRQSFLQVGDGTLFLAQQVEHPQASGVCKRFADAHLLIKDLFFNAACFFAFSKLQE